jgi:uncharacterized protein DUF1016
MPCLGFGPAVGLGWWDFGSIEIRAMSEIEVTQKRPERLVDELRQLIFRYPTPDDDRRECGSNPSIWRVGDRIRREVLENERAAYGKQILATLSQELVAEFGRRFDQSNLTWMMRLLRHCRNN